MPIPKDYQRLERSARAIVPNAKRVKPSDPDEVITVTVAVRRRPGAPALPGQEHWAATPPGARKYLTTEEFTAQYGAAPADLDLVAEFAAKHGLDVLEKNADERTVILSGKVSQTNKAFAVELGHYEYELEPQPEESRRPVDGHPKPATRKREVYRGYEGEVHVPVNIAPIVEGVFGLDNRRMARPAGPFTITPLTPHNVAELYNFPKAPHHIGKETIGLLEFSDPVAGTCGYHPADIHAYFTTALGIGPGFIPPSLTDIGVNGATNSPGGPGDIEVALDIEVAGTVAQGAHIAVYFTTWDENGWVRAIKRAIHPHDGERRPSVLSISWGWPEFDTYGNLTWTPSVIDAVNTAFQEAAMFGMTIIAASGDHGSSCGIGGGKAVVLYPTSDPWLISCGGTSIGNVSGSSFAEETWVPVPSFVATGGGISDVFDLPFWQRHANVPLSVNAGHRKGRGVPDIAGYANGYNIVYDMSTLTGIGGTSEAAPLYAGLIAILNARLGERVGYINPILYSDRATKVFRDVADGLSNATFGAPGYVSMPGWDACTGRGSVDGKALLKLLEREEAKAEEHVTGKVAGLVFDRFGDFEGFLLEDLRGGEHRFESREPEVRQLVHRAWGERIVTTVLTERHLPQRPVSIILRGPSALHP